MNDPVANGQLELACRLSSIDDIAEALEEGADINCNGCSPIFNAIQNADREVIAALVGHGADVSIFEVDESDGDVVDQLMAMAPKQAEENEEPTTEGMVELDAKMIRAFNRMIVNKGIAEPIHKGRRDEYPAFCDGLQALAAEECHAVVGEFLEGLKTETAEAQEGEEAIAAYLKDPANAEKLDELSERYRKATEDEQPGELLKDYLKERKKVA